jgi:hypothetical protein
MPIDAAEQPAPAAAFPVIMTTEQSGERAPTEAGGVAVLAETATAAAAAGAEAGPPSVAQRYHELVGKIDSRASRRQTINGVIVMSVVVVVMLVAMKYLAQWLRHG